MERIRWLHAGIFKFFSPRPNGRINSYIHHRTICPWENPAGAVNELALPSLKFKY